MPLALNKTILKQQRDLLAMYQRYLPSLDLKRRQLIADLQRAKHAAVATELEIDELYANQEGLFALLGASEQDFAGLVVVESVEVNEENRVGVLLPVLGEVQFRRAEYSLFTKPFWCDLLIDRLEELAVLTIRRDIDGQRVQRLHDAVQRITQRVNLFERLLIPRAQSDIQRISIFLSDAERAAVIRSKIAKSRQRKRAHTKRLS